MAGGSDLKKENCELNQITKWTSFDNLIINNEEKLIYLNERSVKLENYEYNILIFFLDNPDRMLTVQEIYENVWHTFFLYSSFTTVLRTVIHLQRKIERDPENPRHLKILWQKEFIFRMERRE